MITELEQAVLSYYSMRDIEYRDLRNIMRDAAKLSPKERERQLAEVRADRDQRFALRFVICRELRALERAGAPSKDLETLWNLHNNISLEAEHAYKVEADGSKVTVGVLNFRRVYAALKRVAEFLVTKESKHVKNPYDDIVIPISRSTIAAKTLLDLDTVGQWARKHNWKTLDQKQGSSLCHDFYEVHRTMAASAYPWFTDVEDLKQFEREKAEKKAASRRKPSTKRKSAS